MLKLDIKRWTITHSRKFGLLLMYALVVAASMWIEHGDEIFGSETCGLGLSVRFWHQRLATAGYRKPRAHFVRIISLARGEQPTADLCEMRRYITPLLTKLREAGPSVIAADMWFSAGLCEDKSKNNETNNGLIQAFADVSKDLPVVVGRPADTAATLRADHRENDLKALQAQGFKEDEVYLSDDLLKSVPQLRFGLAFPNCDNRRIPLDWPLYLPPDKRHPGEQLPRYPTLALLTARAADSQVKERVQELHRPGHRPVYKFHSRRRIPTDQCFEFVCPE